MFEDSKSEESKDEVKKEIIDEIKEEVHELQDYESEESEEGKLNAEE